MPTSNSEAVTVACDTYMRKASRALAEKHGTSQSYSACIDEALRMAVKQELLQERYCREARRERDDAQRGAQIYSKLVFRINRQVKQLTDTLDGALAHKQDTCFSGSRA